jgi:hypothetical protein
MGRNFETKAYEPYTIIVLKNGAVKEFASY